MKYRILNERVINNFIYTGVSYETDGTDCTDPGCGCRHNDYCRRNFIVNPRVESVSISSILSTFLEPSSKRKDVISTKNIEFVDYCVDRLLRIYKVYDPEAWEINRSRGYYGEEIDSINLNCFGNVVTDIKQIIKLTPNERIEFILNKEYGYLLDSIKNKHWSQIEVVPTSLKINNKEYVKKCDGYIDLNSNLPIGIYIKDGDNNYKLIDGYHRYVETMKNKEIKPINIIIGE